MIDYSLLALQNPWWQQKDSILNDPKIKEFQTSQAQYWPREVFSLPLKKGAINIVFGPRQTGKSTALKLLIQNLLDKKVPADRIFYFNCDALESRQDLIDLVLTYFKSLKTQASQVPENYLFLDEISSVAGWPFGIKWLVDAGLLQKSKVILTGSSSISLKKSGEFLPGRRGGGQDLKFLPIQFMDYFKMRFKDLNLPSPLTSFDEVRNWHFKLTKNQIDPHQTYQDFLLTGGFLKMIDLFLKKEPFASAVELYQNTLKSELAKFGKKEIHARQILRKIIASLTAETSYTNIAEEAELGSKNTALDYLSFFTDSFLLSELFFYSIPQKRVVIKKNKKYYPIDPFLLWVFEGFISGVNQIEPFYEKSQSAPLSSQMAEVFVASELYKKRLEIFYFKNKKELDFYLPKRDLGVEIKYKNTITSLDLENLKAAGRKVLVSKNTLEQREGVLIVPVSLFGFVDWQNFKI